MLNLKCDDIPAMIQRPTTKSPEGKMLFSCYPDRGKKLENECSELLDAGYSGGLDP